MSEEGFGFRLRALGFQRSGLELPGCACRRGEIASRFEIELKSMNEHPFQDKLNGRGGCMSDRKTAIITGALGSIGTGLVQGFLQQGYNVVGTSLNSSQTLAASPSLVLVTGDLGRQETAAKIVGERSTTSGLSMSLSTMPESFARSLLRTSLPRTSMPWSQSTFWDSSISRNSQ